MWVICNLPGLPGQQQGYPQGRYTKGSIVEKQAGCTQPLVCWGFLHHDQVQGCQEIVEAHSQVAIQVEGQICGGSYEGTCRKNGIIEVGFLQSVYCWR